MTTTTGPQSTSFKVWLATFVPSIAGAVTAFTNNVDGSKSATLGVASIAAATVASLGKLFHDQGVHKATIAAAGSEVATQLPALKSDLSTAVTFVEQELPSLKGIINDVKSRADSVEARVADIETKATSAVGLTKDDVESVLRGLLGGLVPAATPPAP